MTDPTVNPEHSDPRKFVQLESRAPADVALALGLDPHNTPTELVMIRNMVAQARLDHGAGSDEHAREVSRLEGYGPSLSYDYLQLLQALEGHETFYRVWSKAERRYVGQNFYATLGAARAFVTHDLRDAGRFGWSRQAVVDAGRDNYDIRRFLAVPCGVEQP